MKYYPIEIITAFGSKGQFHPVMIYCPEIEKYNVVKNIVAQKVNSENYENKDYFYYKCKSESLEFVIAFDSTNFIWYILE